MPSLLRRAVGRIRHLARKQSESTNRPIYLIAAAGQPNFGDEFITRAWLDWLARNHPERDVWLDCIEPGRAAHLFADTHPRLRTTNTLWQTAHTGMPEDIADSAERMESLVLGLGSPKTDFGLRLLRDVSSMHLLGGGYMNTLWPRNLAIIAAMTAAKRHFNVPIYATGQGLLPFQEAAQEWMREQLAQFDFAESRDAPGAELFNLTHGDDDAFLAFANERPIYAPSAGLPQSMVLMQGDMFEPVQEPDVNKRVAEFVERHGPAPESIGFAEGIPPEDARFAGSWIESGSAFYPFMRMWDEGFPAFSDQTWLTSRFHFHLLAAAAGAKGVVLNARSGYYDVKHELLRHAGTGWAVQGADESAVLAEATRSDNFPRDARRIGQRKALLASKLYDRRQ